LDTGPLRLFKLRPALELVRSLEPPWLVHSADIYGQSFAYTYVAPETKCYVGTCSIFPDAGDQESLSSILLGDFEPAVSVT
jgi:hypothetical protein